MFLIGLDKLERLDVVRPIAVVIDHDPLDGIGGRHKRIPLTWASNIQRCP